MHAMHPSNILLVTVQYRGTQTAQYRFDVLRQWLPSRLQVAPVQFFRNHRRSTHPRQSPCTGRSGGGTRPGNEPGEICAGNP